MSVSGDGVQRVNVHSMWAHEAYNFTPWLAEHLDILGAELGLTLEEVGREVADGPYFLDILAKAPGEDGGDVLVAIENQLEWSDLPHLGQLLTYATGLDARVAVWVAPEFRRQLAEALHRLNEWTRDGIDFYGVRVEVIRVIRRDGSTELGPRFHKVVWPDGWDEDSTAPDGAQSEEGRLYDDFFKPLIGELVRTGFAAGARQHFDRTGRFFTPETTGSIGYAGYAASLQGQNDAWVTFYIRTDQVEQANRIFDELHDAREESRGGSSPACSATASRSVRLPSLPSGTGAGSAHTGSPASASGATGRSTTNPNNWRRSAPGCSATSPGSRQSSPPASR